MIVEKLKTLENFKTGHPGIDADHKLIIDTIVLVCAAIEDRDEEQCGQLLDAFVEVAKNHFANEEEILRQTAFPGLERHCEYHGELLLRANAVKDLCKEMDNHAHLKECFEEMCTFLIDDIVKGDHEFVSHLKEAGVTED